MRPRFCSALFAHSTPWMSSGEENEVCVQGGAGPLGTLKVWSLSRRNLGGPSSVSFLTRVHDLVAPARRPSPYCRRVPGGIGNAKEPPCGAPARTGVERGGGPGPRGACADQAQRMLRRAAGPQMRGVESPAPLHPCRSCCKGACSEPRLPIKFVKKKS